MAACLHALTLRIWLFVSALSHYTALQWGELSDRITYLTLTPNLTSFPRTEKYENTRIEKTKDDIFIFRREKPVLLARRGRKHDLKKLKRTAPVYGFALFPMRVQSAITVKRSS